MRALAVTIVLLTWSSLYPLFAQNKGKPSADAAQTGASSSVPARNESRSTSENEKRHMLHRMGPGIDWDHRKAGRDWKISPHREKSDDDRKRDGDR